MNIKFEIEFLGDNALLDAKSINKKIKEGNSKGIHTELKKDEPKEGTLSVPEYLPIIMGAAVSAALVTGIFSVITKWMENNLKREEIKSNEKIEENKLKKLIFRFQNKSGEFETYKFQNFDEKQLELLIKKLKDE